MSNAIFPTLPGLAFDVVKTPTFSTSIQSARSGRELRRRNWAHPLYKIGLTFEFLRDEAAFNELKTLAGFYMQRDGSFDSFLFTDPDDYIALNRQYGTGDGVTTTFQLDREFGGAVEPVTNIDASTLMLGVSMWSTNPLTPMWSSNTDAPMWSGAKDYTLGTDYTVSASGLITFTTPPAAGEPLIWNGNYYYRARFNDDANDFTKFMENLWNLKTCDLWATLGDRI